jgi:2-oxoglutarate ferredoxin oxidoreductase subunit delta
MKHRDASDNQSRAAGQPDSPVPAADPEEKPHPEYRVNIYRDWCKSCGICVAFCPRQCLSLDAQGAPQVENSRRCTGCRWCELHCPDFAICVREVVVSEEEKESAE